ncbi:hypothetical protein L2E82_16561 [Cichorium intybus]|uniref:Uncharacterized protein n=1 Tax=Cichorium intybus TaxID=13427 RepID=A0ACB9F6G9_CICIN|nr:hypothetical protein L2E82_16561 [Cichorium intybus]
MPKVGRDDSDTITQQALATQFGYQKTLFPKKKRISVRLRIAHRVVPFSMLYPNGEDFVGGEDKAISVFEGLPINRMNADTDGWNERDIRISIGLLNQFLASGLY